MPENVFKATRIVELTSRVPIETPRFDVPDADKELSEEELYKGPTVAEIEEEISNLRRQWEDDLMSMRKKANDDAGRILEDARTQSFEIYKAKQNESRVLVENAKEEASRMIKEATEQVEEIEKNAQVVQDNAKREGYKEGYQEGVENAIKDGNVEVRNMVEKLKKILGETINKRNDIIDVSEAQIIDIAVLIAKRVVKMITEKDKNVVVRNIQEALRRVKGRARVTIRVNIDDLEVSARHKDEFYQMLDKIEGVTILEDPNVDIGGCIIETDFGDIDARISTQLNEIETAIKEVEPIRNL